MSLTDKTPVKLPLAVWLVTLAAAASAGVAYNSLRAENEQNRVAVHEVATRVDTQAAEQQTMREVLIRIDENVKQLRRDSRTVHP